MPLDKTLIVLTGPTGIGKTALSLSLAQSLGCSILSCDSRQVYREMSIGTAVPSPRELQLVKHYFIQTISVKDYYSAGRYELDVLALLPRLFTESPVQLMVGGSMLYIDAVCNGLDDIPHPSEEVMRKVNSLLQEQGLTALQQLLFSLDPPTYHSIDLFNPQRVIHAVAVSMQAGKPYSSLLTNKKASRPFKILKIGLTLQRDLLYQRINHRVERMMQDGLEDEARQLYPLRHFNALNTVGYKQLFDCFDGRLTLDEAVERIKRDTRRYAKRQLTWFNADADIHWFTPDQQNEILQFIRQEVTNN